jgi:transposase-like protein
MAGMSHVMDNQFTILKRDGRGRVRSTPQMRQEAVAEYQRSGLSATAFAKMAGIAPNTFWNWLHDLGLTQKRPRQQPPPAKADAAPQPVRFLQVSAPVLQPPESALRVRLPGGAVMEVCDAAHVELAARLIQTLSPAHAP